jgi:hypothetical protein
MVSRNQEGLITFTVDDREEVIAALKEVFRTTEVGKLYLKDFYTKERGDDHAEKILGAAIQIAGSQNISVQHLTRALELLLDSGEIQPRVAVQAAELEEPAEDTRPRDKNGKLLTPQQIAWSEMTQFASTATPDAIRQRRHTDHIFAEFVRTNLRREMAATEVGDAVTPAGQPTTKARASQELVDFARKYNAEPIANLRPKGGFVRLEGEQLMWATFNDLLSRASAANLL